MKIRLYCENGANCQSLREETIDTVKEWGMEEGEWENKTEEEKQDLVKEWVYDRLEYGYQEL